MRVSSRKAVKMLKRGQHEGLVRMCWRHDAKLGNGSTTNNARLFRMSFIKSAQGAEFMENGILGPPSTSYPLF